MFATLLLSTLTLLPIGPSEPDEAATLLRGATVFDGEQWLGRRDVLLRGDVIAAVGTELDAPTGASVVEAGDAFLVPGLMDAHTHTFDGSMLTLATHFGVTTGFDMFTDVGALDAMRASDAPGRCDLLSAGVLATAPGGHGTQFGVPIPTLTAPDQAAAFVDQRLAEGSDFIKIVYDDGHSMGFDIPTVSRTTLEALVTAAHAAGRLAVVHVHDHDAAREALEAGADGLVHTFVDELPDDSVAALAADRGAFVVPTLAVIESVCGRAGGAELAADARLAEHLTLADRLALEAGFPPPGPGAPPRDYDVARRSVAAFHAAGVPVLAGSDAPNPGTLHGASLHRELELLVDAGLTPDEALAAATSVVADAFGLDDRGRIAAGQRADLLLLDADPREDITATRDLRAVWQRGVPVDLAARAAVVAAERNSPGGAGLPTLIADFEGGGLGAAFGMDWIGSTDELMGGRSTVDLSLARNGGSSVLAVDGELVAEGFASWSGAMWCPGRRPFDPVDLSDRRTLRFRVRAEREDGASQPGVVMMFAASTGRMPVSVAFTAGPEWSEQSLELSRFAGIDAGGLTALMIGGAAPGPFRLLLDDVRLE